MLEALISLSDEQMDIVVRTAGPLDPRDRALFLLGVAQALRGNEISDEAVAGACVEARRPRDAAAARIV